MGLLSKKGNAMLWGSPVHGDAVREVREHGVLQFLKIYHRCYQIDNFPFLWGDELEHLLIQAQHSIVGDGTSTLDFKLSLDATAVLDALVKIDDPDVDWRPEYGSFMIESVPREPYTSSRESLLGVQANIERRYQLINQVVNARIESTANDTKVGEAEPNGLGTTPLPMGDRFSVTLVSFPLMGVGDFTTAGKVHEAPYSQSFFIPDVCINSHPRFWSLTENIRLRRGGKVVIRIPMYIDVHTRERNVCPLLNIDRCPPKPLRCHFCGETTNNVCAHELRDGQLYTPALDYYYAQYARIDPDTKRQVVEKRYTDCPATNVGHPSVYMDCMAFGMGCCCLQVTFQLRNITEARYVYDQLAVLCPLLLAATSATPFQKGTLTDSDVRWMTISSSVDDRQRDEVPRILKSRYDSVSTFISSEVRNIDEFNDSPLEVDDTTYRILQANGIDNVLARHIAHLFIRDPLVIFDKTLGQDDELYGEHFENIQSTNWQTVRFKPPPPGTSYGWRVEFRVMDVMPTPFENAAFSIFISLITRAIVKYKLFFYTPLSAVDENMGRAHRREPLTQKYTFRKDVFVSEGTTSEAEMAEMDCSEIFQGRASGFIGLIPIVKRFAQEEGLEFPALDAYLEFIGKRCSRELPTAAAYLRNMVLTHHDYQKDSRLTPSIARDIVLWSRERQEGIVDENFIPSSLFEKAKQR